MIIKTLNGSTYKLPGNLSKFQEEMYVHLINWKWKNITEVLGVYMYKGKEIKYDAILPKSVQKSFPIIYPPVLFDLLEHKKRFYFKLHQHFNHMVSSQAANINLFLPILLHHKADNILNKLKPDFKSLVKEELYKGFRIEYWDGNSKDEKGLLGDHSVRSGTDSDIAIAYLNHDKEPCLWLIEHKLTEAEFTTCGGYKSNGRDMNRHLCEKSFSEILANKNLCYYHDIRKFNYWNLTDEHKGFFVNHINHESWPFRGGMNQLWRNQLLGLALEDAGWYKHVYFSVVRHPDNQSLDNSIKEYENLINHNPKFSTFTSLDVIKKAECLKAPTLDKWIKWYKELYKIC